MVLGDSFPDKKKQEYVDRSLVPGMVVRLYCPFTSPPKHKFLLLLSINPDPVFFVINTQPNRFLIRNFPDQQIPMKQSDYSTFLSCDSVIDCSTPRSDFTFEDMRKKVLADLGRIKGKLVYRDRAAVVDAIIRNRTIEARLKRELLKEMRTP
jgi:hypothetical protein